MRKMSIWLVLGMVLCLLMAYPLEAAKRPLPVRIGKGIVKVNYLEGQAQARVATQERWQDLKVGQILRGGDEVQVGKGSKLELRLPDGSMLRFAGGTYFRIDSAPDKDAPDVDVHLMVGRSWAKVQAAAGVKRSFGISTENAVAGVRGTVFRMNAEDDKSALVKVYEGEVEVKGQAPAAGATDRAASVFGAEPVPIEGPKPVSGPRPISMEEWTVLLKAMQQVVIHADGTAEAPQSFTPEEDRDDWVDWNQERDRNVARELGEN